MQSILEVFGTAKKEEKGLLSLGELTKITATKWSATKFLFGEGILNKPEFCPNCKTGVSFKKDPYLTDVKFAKGLVDKGPSEEKACFTYRCKNRKCSWNQSVFHGTLFAYSKKNPNQILMFLHLWLTGMNIQSLIALSSWSEKAVLEYCSLFRKMVTSLINHWLEVEAEPEIYTYQDGRVGDAGIEVQIDESAFGRRKYNRGHHVETKWVFGGVEIVPDAKGRKTGQHFFAVVVPDRTRETLFNSIRKHIRPGSIIISDKWSSYATISDIEGYDFTHFSVNHSECYVDPLTNACTNTIEGKWNGLKKKIPRQGFRNETVLQHYLVGEQMWRRSNRGHLWMAALSIMKIFVKSEGAP